MLPWPKPIRAFLGTGSVVIPHPMGTEENREAYVPKRKIKLPLNGGGNGGLDVNNNCSLQQLVASCLAMPFTTHLDFIFFCHKVT